MLLARLARATKPRERNRARRFSRTGECAPMRSIRTHDTLRDADCEADNVQMMQAEREEERESVRASRLRHAVEISRNDASPLAPRVFR